MYHIAIVEDERTFSEQLQEFLKEYQEEKNIKFKISVFKDGAEILEEYKQIYDIILLDIENAGNKWDGDGKTYSKDGRRSCSDVYYKHGILRNTRV